MAMRVADAGMIVMRVGTRCTGGGVGGGVGGLGFVGLSLPQVDVARRDRHATVFTTIREIDIVFGLLLVDDT